MCKVCLLNFMFYVSVIFTFLYLFKEIMFLIKYFLELRKGLDGNLQNQKNKKNNLCTFCIHKFDHVINHFKCLIDVTNIGREFEIYYRANSSPVAKTFRTNLLETIGSVNSPYCLLYMQILSLKEINL